MSESVMIRSNMLWQRFIMLQLEKNGSNKYENNDIKNEA